MKNGDIVEVRNPVSLFDGYIGEVKFIFGCVAIVVFDGKETQIDLEDLEIVNQVYEE